MHIVWCRSIYLEITYFGKPLMQEFQSTFVNKKYLYIFRHAIIMKPKTTWLYDACAF